MKKTFKKIIASVIAVTSLAVGTVSTNVSAASIMPIYGGTDSFVVNGVSVQKYIDAAKSVVSAYTKCDSSSCSWVYVSLTGKYSSTGSKEDSFSATRGKVSVNLTADTGKSFAKANSYHSAKINGVSDSSSMVANC